MKSLIFVPTSVTYQTDTGQPLASVTLCSGFVRMLEILKKFLKKDF